MLEFERKSREPRKAQVRPVSMSALSELKACATSPIDALLPTPEERLRELSRSQPVTLIPIDTSGMAFQRQCEYRESIRSLSREYLDTKTRKRQRRRTIVGIPGLPDVYVNSEFSFSAIEPKFRSMSRERWERPRSMASLEHYSVKEKWKPKENTHYDNEETNLATSCSIGRSLKSLFKRSRSKRDLWTEGKPMSPGPPVVRLQSKPSKLPRSKSLPRSLKATFKHSLPFLAARKKSASVEDQLDVCDDGVEEPVMHAPRRRRGHGYERMESNHYEKIPAQDQVLKPMSISYHGELSLAREEKRIKGRKVKSRSRSTPGESTEHEKLWSAGKWHYCRICFH